MVTRFAPGLPLSLSMLFLGVASTVHADGILEQMQNEVAAIVKANKGGIVLIEDERAMPPLRRGGPNGEQRPNAEGQALVGHLAELQVKQDTVAVQLTQAQSLYTATNPKVVALKHEKEADDAEVQKLFAEMLKRPDGPQLQQMLQGIQLMQWTQKRDALQADLQKSQAIAKSGHSHVQELRQELHVADANVTELTKLQQNRRGPNGPNPFDRTNAPKSGSGFSIGNGYVVTTSDVVEGMQHPLVIADDGTHIRAKLVGIDSRLNLGLLQLPAKVNLPALKMGNSDNVTAGHFAIVIGNQAGHANFAALTMVSGVRNEGMLIRNESMSSGERFYPALIQVSGTIDAGTSGAPILNAHGEVIGVIAGVPSEWTETQVYSDPPLSFLPPASGSSQSPDGRGNQAPQPEPRQQNSSNRGRGRGGYNFGPGQSPPGQAGGMGFSNLLLRSPMTNVGFAIPINDLQFSINELMTHGKIVQTWVGFRPDFRPDFKLDATDPEVIRLVRSIRIRKVDPDSPAFKAGLQPGDTLLELDSKPIVSNSELFRYLMHLHPADKLMVTFQRNGVKQTVTLNVELRPEKTVPPPTNAGH